MNIRYLGLVSDQIKDKNLSQMKFVLEREVVVRTLKHILHKYIRENPSEELLSASIAHILNCLLAPKDFLKKLDDGVVAYKATTLKQVADLIQPVPVVEEKKNVENVEEQEKPKLTKKEMKKLRMKQAKNAGDAEG